MNKSLAFFVLTLLPASLAAQVTWKADPVHSKVLFGVTHMVISEVTGLFRTFEATLVQPGKDDFAGSTVEATIQAGTINTENDMRDRDIRSDHFLNTEKYPMITFKSTSFEKTGDNTYKITGDLTMRDSTKSVVLDAKYNGQVTDQRGNIHAGFKATTSIDRFAFGVKANAALESGGLIVGKDISITLNLELVQPKKAAGEQK